MPNPGKGRRRTAAARTAALVAAVERRGRVVRDTKLHTDASHVAASTSKRVVAGAITNGNKYVLAQRHSHVAYAKHFELPGGKVQDGESDFDALCRELREELGIVVTAADEVAQTRSGADNEIDVRVYAVHAYDGRVCGAEGQLVQWLELSHILDGRLLTPATAQFFRAQYETQNARVEDEQRTV